ncbi:beta-1,3-galactosyl-O-glycosyl-glycoprotein beta-1,6-N-acetylglucosaminyltransferase 3 [Lingula anatina]|uniref:Beta-1,3-galactosyl-O-glycosyl-glycoprotein beta-1,6-N-acetylglucosaminyltransferase 3 n=1 Tax=Lingula anatina TaxID=7574 RepID=A0A1S3H254_LINAN|nr:beta-1,3-galactosyl-O-glycosyl-glycoprotein beta-1,6-N-acetylglucosaminyltransferase 3 [Lingula anatina]XP_013379217.1 beta-1,3-galactosyl-O-glycosyl-glycoprotein beta-1,6-N-acetylglucosaminyltransferase 3 [Lingula anatina]XP_013379218.1 beta-1,3-galactosyl-O-glycosyl-glycoprotein beta-1,6-N-acetylglucosaminyltransferase 3 [Lingula anatina]XP_013379219.1 beta-1,3-galactosyl-O-glycosyl-glycoprotein beta-1,6-N-acetylglucosaminyltransferase 3 [Lingula anatina]XP_013379220.1 beta-1,3-galactosyl-|eukprot:XP_013379216.1 beta-1,3-galactosyl-O-glycosyl-glycoprotein beta-1,6-N-acetylglucosaminyltransferase 3 [Lingula anatina]
MKSLVRLKTYYIASAVVLLVYFLLRTAMITNITTDPDEQLVPRVDEDDAGSLEEEYPQGKIPSESCRKLFEGDQKEIRRMKKHMSQFTPKVITDQEFVMLTKDCEIFQKEHRYSMTVNEEEKNFPIAFSILLYKDVVQAERLLRTIYRPHNVYCLHVDAKSQPSVLRAVEGIARCFHNVFIATRLEEVIYAGYSRLQAEINCMNDTLHRKEEWKYYINLASQAFPLRTNREMVQILKLYNGANDIEGITGARLQSVSQRFNFHWKLTRNGAIYKLERSKIKKNPPPYNITIVRGSAYGIFSRNFVEFILHNPAARALLSWSRDTYSPDEFYWATLHHLMYNPHLKTPGGYAGVPDKKAWLAVYAAWGGVDPCAGRWMRAVCVMGVGDLHRLIERKEFFVNKFLYDFEPPALDCAEEWIRAKATFAFPFDLNYYRALPFLKK